MYGSLFWIEWLDRLDRVLTAARGDVAAVTRAVTPRSLEALERSKRQLSALTNDLRLLDRSVLAVKGGPAIISGADGLQMSLDTAVFQLGNLRAQAPRNSPLPDRVLAAVDAALRDSFYEAAILLQPSRRRA